MSIWDPNETLKLSHKDVTLDYTLMRHVIFLTNDFGLRY